MITTCFLEKRDERGVQGLVEDDHPHPRQEGDLPERIVSYFLLVT